MNDDSESLKVAVLNNGFESPFTPFVRASFVSAISAAASLNSLNSYSCPPIIDFYDPIITQQYPDPVEYDLIVLSGGTADPMGHDPWVLKQQKYLRKTVNEHPKQKIVGICWGHQTISVTFGGVIRFMAEAELGVTQIVLTGEGRKMFPLTANAYLIIHEFHRREVEVPAKGFKALAKGSQSFLNDANTIMTFQGHLEMTGSIAKVALENIPNYMGVDETERGAIAEKIELPHDEVDIWKKNPRVGQRITEKLEPLEQLMMISKLKLS